MSSKPKQQRDTEPDLTSAKQEELVQTSALSSARQQEIRIRAYEIYIARNGQPGDELSDWLQAEREIESQVRHEEVSN